MTDDEDQRLQTAIEAATGSAQPFIGGGVGPGGRVVWIEESGGSYYLHTAGRGIPDVNREIETYNPWFGCTVNWAGWFGDEALAIYREKHRTIVWAVPVFEPAKQRLTDIEDNAVVDGDAAFFEGDEPGLVESIALPSFEPRAPIPFEGTARLTQIDEETRGEITLRRWDRATDQYVSRGSLRLPSAEQRGIGDASLCGAIERALTAPDAPPPIASLITGCVADAFWRRRYPVYTTYHGKPRTGGESIHWLPVYWYEHLRSSGREDEARELLAFLDAIAAPLAGTTERGWEPEWSLEEGLVRLGTRHVRRRAAVLADVCRTGRPPEHHFCYLFDGPNKTPRSVDLTDLPRSVASVWEQLASATPLPTSLSRRPD